ncbi:MAG: 1-acyl-sn-glycerol-3-phosphate acyltransferase [Puniceicoccales bacterium]|jgi:1-acyl-sn-glycerol-3-phosphate acyltransferase|nr:1-acyl-sn-glycerol-3-phosphate acyltransferase [Puniceicoccales bacterium]
MRPLQSDNPTYILSHHIARWFITLFGRVDARGLHNIPPGPSILASNHQSHIDPALIAGTLGRELYFFARKTLFDQPLLGHVMRTCNTIPVDRDAHSDITAFKRIFTALRNGHPLLIFPEGTRSPDEQLQNAQPGIGLIACKTQIPVVPIRAHGTHAMLPRNALIPRHRIPLTITYAPPMAPAEYDPGEQHPARYHEAARRIMARIAAIPPLPETLA